MQCPEAEFQSIQEAVAAAPPGSTIMVCPDLYTETVTVPKPLTLMKHGGGNGEIDERPRCFEPEPPDPTRDAIVDGATYSFALEDPDIVLDGFVVQGSLFGIRSASSVSTVRDNLVQNNAFVGLNQHSGGRARVTGNCFRHNRIGVHTDLSGARIDENRFFQNSEVGALLIVSVVDFHHNISRQDGSFFVAAGGLNQTPISGPPSAISHNESLGSGTVAAVFTFSSYSGGNVGTQITHNRLRQARDGITLTDDFNLEVAYNDIAEMRRDGIRADYALFDALIAYNRSMDNGEDGLNFQAATGGNRVEFNEARRNGSDGIQAQGTEGNVFRTNVMFDNVEHDAHDDARHANRWIHNQCRTDFPTGTICGFSDPAP